MENTTSLSERVEKILKGLGLSREFYNRLSKQDDWSFVIKSHALIEAAVTQLLVTFLDKDQLADFFSFTELSDKRKGKAKLCRTLKILSEDDVKYIYAFSELRNELVHKIANTNFSFKEQVDSGVAKKTDALMKLALKRFKPEVTLRGKLVKTTTWAKESPKDILWLVTMFMLADMFPFMSPGKILLAAMMP